MKFWAKYIILYWCNDFVFSYNIFTLLNNLIFACETFFSRKQFSEEMVLKHF